MHNQPIIQLVKAPLPSELIAHRYEVVRVLGSGAFGTVYHCLDTQLARLPVALKFFHAHTLKSTLTQTRIHRELRACFKVQHDNTIFFYDTVRDAENFGFTMELVDGNPLTKLCTPEFQPSFTQTLEILKQTTLGLRAIHKCKIIHRDLKPANVLLSRNGIVKVTDFGLARRPLDGIDCSHEISAAFSKLPDACVTASSHLVGSPAYICPHYLKTQQFTHLCDLYAIGMIGFELLTARRPFDESSTKQLLLNKMQKDAPNAAEFNPQIPLSLSELIATLLQREPSKRYQSCDQILDVIENCKS